MRKKDDTCFTKAPDEEMVFVLLSRDVAAPIAIRAWVAERLRVGKNVATDATIVEALECARTMEIEGAKWKPKPPAPAPRSYLIAFWPHGQGEMKYLVDLESEETADKSRAMRFSSLVEVEKMLRAHDWIAAKGGMIALSVPVPCPRQVFVDDGWPPGACRLEHGHAGSCELWSEANPPAYEGAA
jgi:hypothetical protein